jgi:hypothetical protein
MGIFKSLCGLVGAVRLASAKSRVNSTEYRLSQSHFWTDVTHVDDGGASQLMRLPDGNFLILSMGLNTAKVFVASELATPTTWVEVTSLQLNWEARRMLSRAQRRAVDEALLERLRKAIAWPSNANESGHAIAALPPRLLWEAP